MNGRKAKKLRREHRMMDAVHEPDISLNPNVLAGARMVIVEGKINSDVVEVKRTDPEQELDDAKMRFAKDFPGDEILSMVRMVHKDEPEVQR